MKHEQQAYDLGVEHAKNAASWVLDGNATEDHYRGLLQMIDDGDPELYDYLPAAPNLSGEWADAPTPQSLVESICGTEFPLPSKTFETECADAYEQGVTDTFVPECQRLLRSALSPA